MTQKAQDLIDAALDLSFEERAALIDQLISSMSDDSPEFAMWLGNAERRLKEMETIGTKEVQTAAENAFGKELLRRLDTYRRGETGSVDGKEMIARSRELVKRARERSDK